MITIILLINLKFLTMKKMMRFMMIAMLLATVFTSCKKDEDEPIPTPTASLLKTISFYADWAGGTEKWEFTYDASSKKVTKFDNFWEGALDKTITYNYETAGKLILYNGVDIYNEYEVNAQGFVSKEYWNVDKTEWAAFGYNADGFLTTITEHWGDADHLKYEITIADGNITKITTYDDDGVTKKKIKEFTYTIGDNINNLHQANAVDSDWKTNGNFYGKPSKKLVDYFEYWDPRIDPIVKSKSTLTYEFDTKDRPTKVTKTLTDLTTEVWEYTYYEDAK